MAIKLVGKISGHKRIFDGKNESKRVNKIFVFLFLATNTIDIHPPVVSDDSMVMPWMNPYPDCVNVEYEYQLYRESDGQLVGSGIIMKNELTLSELECDTRYRLRLREKMNKMIGADNWISVKTNTQGE